MLLLLVAASGSPPRMRGKVRLAAGESIEDRITPAYAGKSFGLVIKFLRHGDHPRVCGEKAYNRVIIGSLWGSPPRMRGKGRQKCPCEPSFGITPAYAGKRPMPLGCPCPKRDHPRVCGEKSA